MTLTKPTFPSPDHDHGRCAEDALHHAERVCEQRAQKFTPIRRQVLQALLSSHRPLGAYEVIDELALEAREVLVAPVETAEACSLTTMVTISSVERARSVSSMRNRKRPPWWRASSSRCSATR